MFNAFFYVLLTMLPAVTANAQGVELNPEDFASTLGAGGSGGVPKGDEIQPEFNELTDSQNGVTSMSFGVSARRPRVPARPLEYVLTRQGMQKAIDAALNSQPVSISVGEEMQPIRLQKLDLEKGILSGRFLDSKKTFLLIDQQKAGLKP